MRKFDVTNGPGIRTTLFVSGCTHNCPGCFNLEQQSFDYGNRFTKETEDLLLSYINNPQIEGVNILGGEPLQQLMDNSLLELLRRIKIETKKPIWLWSGYTFEDSILNPKIVEILEFVDVLIDGIFDISKKDLSLKYRGSSNQRIIDVKTSLNIGSVILYPFNS
ncbi:MAG: anaerobic ribonucleoside-triphosphate reductase activating protein [Clostridium sp.]